MQYSRPKAIRGSGPRLQARYSKHHWLIINCDSCGTVVDLDLRIKPRDPEASVRVALRDVQCPRCNGYGRPRSLRWRGIRRFDSVRDEIQCERRDYGKDPDAWRGDIVSSCC
jgi:hypothetical protein